MKNRKGFAGTFYGKHFENPEHHNSGYDGDYGASESNQIGKAVLLLRRWYR